jgi:hypothetical protein
VLNNFRNLNSLYRSLGARWLMFRIGYSLSMLTGLIRRQIPAYAWRDRPLGAWLKNGIPSTPEAYARWRRQNSPAFFFQTPVLPESVSWNPQLAVSEAERFLNGELKYFAHAFFQTGFPPDWHKEPFSGSKVNSSKHWSRISNEGDLDIKFIWEASRFSMVYTLVRAYAATREEKFAEAFWELVGSWAESNPPNMGPNWMDGQEAALRLMAWTFGFQAFLDLPATTPERIAQFMVLVGAHADRIYRNIGFAISTRSNHTISEAFGLWMVGLLFPELKESEKYLSLGRRLLEEEAAAQIFPDGSYSMYSLNYHRFILHIYLCAIRLAELNQSPLSLFVFQRVFASLDYLYELIDPQTGQMPVYGSNDGALVLPLNNCDFTDYRPLLQMGSYVMKKKLLFEPGPWDEDLFWLCGVDALFGRVETKQQEQTSFPQGGVYLLRDSASKVLIRCTDFRSRPSHADQLHVDLWLQGTNIACDAGTYIYNGQGIWRNGLAHTSVHNTVTVDGQDQMKRVSRFIWTNWARGKVLHHDPKSWQGQHDGYKRLADPVRHVRTVLSLGEDRWLVVDQLDGKQPHQYALHWLLADLPYEQQDHTLILAAGTNRYRVQVGTLNGKPAFSLARAEENSTRGWRSRYYAHKESAISVLLEAHQPRAIFWSFFGSESDSVESTEDGLTIHFADGDTSISLQSLFPSL